MLDTETFIGRQPILDKDGKCVAYELLYRNTHECVDATFNDNTKATARVIINLIHNIGFSSILGDKRGFINVDDHILLSDALLSLPKERFIFEILEYTKMSVAVIDKVRHLHDLGYRFALDDFYCSDKNIDYYQSLFPYIDILKIDLLVTERAMIEKIVSKFKSNTKMQILAEKVEDIEVFEWCKQAGFTLFQGYFFEKPVLISGKKIEPSVANAMDLINTLYTTSDLQAITHKFSHYPDLTFNLLRYINSASYNFKSEITSIRQILNLLGPTRLRSWLGLFLYAGSEEHKFQQVIVDAAKFRANMMKEIVHAQGKRELEDEAFLTGSLSLIDTYLQISMEEIVEKIGLSNAIKDALMNREGYFGKLLTIVERLEKSDQLQNMIEHLAPKLNMTPFQLYTLYWKANEIQIDK